MEEIIFSLVPRKVMIQPADAADVINDSRAFLSYLHRTYALERALECMNILDDSAVDRLSDALGDADTFGMGKSIFSPANQFSPYESPPLPGPSATKPKPASKKSRKKKRSAARKARKKNR